MANPTEKLAYSLDILKELQDSGKIAIHASDLSRVHRERLVKNGFLQEVMKGWYIPSSPNESAGESTAWYASFWAFCAAYLDKRFGKKWCLSPEQSILLHAGNWTVPNQLLIRSQKANNKVTPLLHKTSLFEARYVMPNPKYVEEKQGLRIYSLPAALINCSPRFFQQNPIDARVALCMVQDVSEILSLLLEGGHSTIAGRLVGAFRSIDRKDLADEILQTMHAAGYNLRESDPFAGIPITIFSSREHSPYINRMHAMWNEMRNKIIDRFPKAPGLPANIKTYLNQVEETYVTDAYHSLSIEGYRVSRDLILKVRNKTWNPDKDESDKDHKNALAARGYWQAFQQVKQTVHKALKGENPGKIVKSDHRIWYRELFAPSVAAGILKPSDLAGYRNGPVYIRRSMHVPPNYEAVRELMPAYFELLEKETEVSVQIVLSHFLFVYIHPYFDGNGRIGRFLMNVMLAAGGYPWTVIPVEKRTVYMSSLEEASVRQNIVPFTDFIAEIVADRLAGKSTNNL